MFTGCIEHCGQILDITPMPAGIRLHIATHYPDLMLGESIAVDGICLTVTTHTNQEFYCDISPETLAVSNAHTLTAGSIVNLERSLQLHGRLNGHFVMGHVDQVCQVATKTTFTDYVEYQFNGLLPEAKAYLVKKGSIAINGVSLTVNTICDATFSVMLIPETLRNTNLSQLKIGDSVNIEYDYLAKLVVNHRAHNHFPEPSL